MGVFNPDLHRPLCELDPVCQIQFKKILREYLKRDGNAFDRYFFKSRTGKQWITNQHHLLIDRTLQRVLDGEITRLIINIPPGYTKTEKAVISFISRGLAINPQAKFIHASYSDDIALWNSQAIRDTIETEEFQELYPMTIRSDTKAKKMWFTEQGGGMLAAASGGSILGFRAGLMEANVFSGALIYDDPIKPLDALSPAKRNKVNSGLNSTIKTRLALESTPIILIMQRVHDDDLSAFLLKGGSREKWHHLMLPSLILETPDKYPVEYDYSIPIPHDFKPGPLWAFKHSEEALLTLKEADPYMYACQHEQKPAPLGGGIFKEKYWNFYAQNPGPEVGDFPALPLDIVARCIYADTAQKTKEHNDYTVFQCWGFSPSKGVFLIDQIRDKWEAPELQKNAIMFWNKHREANKENNYVGARAFKIEDKSSGSGLIQTLKSDTLIPVEGVQKNTDKVYEAIGCIPQIAAGNVWLPIDAPFIQEYLLEHNSFTPLMTHANDDQIDTTLMAIKDMLINKSSFYDIF